jgi:hypothetical protein
LLEELPARPITSELTFIEAERAIARARNAGRLDSAQHRQARHKLHVFRRFSLAMPLEGEVLDRARQPFPKEPVRTLDAIHLASMLLAESTVGRIRIFSLDKRILANCDALGLDVE